MNKQEEKDFIIKAVKEINNSETIGFVYGFLKASLEIENKKINK